MMLPAALVLEGKTMRQVVLEEEQIKRMLMRFRFDPEFRGADGRVPIKQFARAVNITPQTLYHFMAGDLHLRYDTRERVLAGLEAVKRGLRWHRHNNSWVAISPDDNSKLLLPKPALPISV
jgi:hypothetical protein